MRYLSHATKFQKPMFGRLIPLPLASWDDSLFEMVTAASINEVVAFDDRGLIFGINGAFEALFPYGREEVLGRGLSVLFQPFITTKTGEMGIGLAITRSLIESYGGSLSVAPNEGGSTVFHFTLPPVAAVTE